MLTSEASGVQNNAFIFNDVIEMNEYSVGCDLQLYH